VFWTIVLIAAAAGLVWIALRSWRKTATAPAPASRRVPAPTAAAGDIPLLRDMAEIPYATETIEAVVNDCFKLAFGITHFDYRITGEHAAVLDLVGQRAAESVHQRDYFPRRPMMLPKLLQALNDNESTRQALVRLILQDPALAGSVLQRANSVFYRYSPEPVDSLDRAIVMLGMDGLRSLVATAILQPVFSQPRGYFDNFAATTWEQARRSAIAAEAYVRSTQSSTDPFIAQLLGLLGPLACIVLFRLTMEVYRDHPNAQPRAEVFIRAMQLHSARVAKLIATTWELSDPSVAALQEQVDQVPPSRMSVLGRAVYFGELCGTLAVLATQSSYSIEGAQAMLIGQGLPREATSAMWDAAMAANDENRPGTASR
jgi:HD-like signal output (HDOD) protein